jgi:long-chain acyl-CoA synthetase
MDLRPWHKSYPPQLPRKIDLAEDLTLAASLEASMLEHAARAAIRCQGETLSYGDVDRLSRGWR